MVTNHPPLGGQGGKSGTNAKELRHLLKTPTDCGAEINSTAAG